jgi:anti-anti-sigma factor
MTRFTVKIALRNPMTNDTANTAQYTLCPRLDGTNATSIEKELLALLAGAVTGIEVDLTQTDYVSSAGLRVFLVSAKAAKARGGKVVLMKPKPAIVDVLKVSGFDRIISIEN